nr:uncharacterized protein LOC116432824 isoform X3 [Nomia melanderi]
MSRSDRLAALLALLCVFGLARAIYHPREATTKPPKRIEPALAWYLSEKDVIESTEDPSRSPKWQTDPDNPIPKKPYTVNAETKTWIPWSKVPDTEIQHKTDISETDCPKPINVNRDGDYALEYSDYEQQENRKFPSVPADSRDLGQRRDRSSVKNKEDKHNVKSNQDYEEIPADNTKPHKEELSVSSSLRSTVARYDSKLGVQCPDFDSTGQFVYPPDCKFFVNCWKGRAFVQPCAPGTLFNPDTLECDFPHKVSCYGGEVAEFPSTEYLDSLGRREPLASGSHAFLEHERLREPRCPPQITGMLPHPSDCTKFLQCANGGTHIMDCGPGTVFNPAISVCDWPRNVRGCEDALKSSDTTTPLVPPDYETFEHKKLQFNRHEPAKKIVCPADFTGLLPHPDTCTKFLQCANGGTFIMDCGPGTAFNPSISVCDWPYNVPGCSEKKTTTAKPWSSGSDSRNWEHTVYNQYGRGQSMSPSNPTTSRPATDWDALRPTWRPSWMPNSEDTAKPPEADSDTPSHNWKPHWTPNTRTTPVPPHWSGQYGHGSQYDGNVPSYPRHPDESDRWGPKGNPGSPSVPWQQGPGSSGHVPNHMYHQHHHHVHHHYPYGSTHNGSGRPETQQPAPPSGPQPQGPRQPDGRWQPEYHHHDHHHSWPHPGPSLPEYHESGQQTQRPFLDQKEDSSNIHESEQHTTVTLFDQTEDSSNIHESDQQTRSVIFEQPNPSNTHVRFDHVNLPSNRRSWQELTPNRQEHGRNDPRFPQPGYNQQPLPGENVYVDNTYKVPENDDRQTRNKTIWTHSVSTPRFAPRISNQQGPRPSSPEGHPQPENKRWNQEEPPFPSYYVPPVEPLDHARKVSHPTPISGQVIRLRGGSGPHEGYVEVQGKIPGWGVVCDSRNSWTLKEAHVVCKQLGYTRGAEMAWQGRNNRNGIPSWIAADSVSCQGNETRFQMCKFTHGQHCRVERDAVGVSCVLNRVAHCRSDEIPYEGHCYHLAEPDSGLNHAEALDYCSRKQARLVDITSQAENDFISEWLLQMHPEIGSIMTSGVGFTTLNHTLWLWEDSSQAKFKFSKWWPGWLEDKQVPPHVGSRPLCIVMKRKLPCHERPDTICVADYFFWDTEDCTTSAKGHSYICKRPYDDIGCVYGKGAQYMGNANVTASGKRCLPWADEKVAHSLRILALSRDTKEKLKTHNYCRNLQPLKESRPWCFTEPNGQREHCDIPPCGNIGSQRSSLGGLCMPKHFECSPGECIPSQWVCDGEEDCRNGADESDCSSQMDLYQKYAKHKLEGHDVEKWLNTPLKTCAVRCKDADFTCRSFSHKAAGNICLLSHSNVGMTGSLKPNREFDYYEMKERSLNCDGMFVCDNKKCINQTKVCNGKNDCHDRSDESICTLENLDYAIRLAGSNNSYEGRIEVKVLGVWGQVCDDGFGMIDADVVCKELGFTLGALEIRPGGFYGNLDPPTRFIVDQLQCRGNETSLRECDFDGWGVHNCQPEEAVGVVCKTAVDTCQDGHWKCEKSPTCIPTAFICDEVVDCPDGSDESSQHCDAPFEIRLANGSSPLEGRVEVRHHGVWGTVCDDDFSTAAATVICRSLGYTGKAFAKKDGYFGPGEGPIWLDEVSCRGNETQLYRCEHNHWGQNNCNHDEDAGVICTRGDVNDSELDWDLLPDVMAKDINDILPTNCGQRLEDFNSEEDLIFAKVVHGSIAPKGSYPWQASIRVRGHSRSNHWCGAVVLSPLHVLTAAHCLEGYNKGTYFVRAGDYNTEIDEGTEAEANIENYYIHEDFRKGHRMNNDIALVLLKGRGIALGKDIMPICLPPENIEYPAGLNCTISGFGSIDTGKSAHSKDLRYGWVPLLDQSVCRAEHVYGPGAIRDGMVCAGFLDEGADTCDGDSGGPLVCHHNGGFTLYGITSWGQHCGKVNKPGVYVRVSHYRRWIDQKIKESLSGR